MSLEGGHGTCGSEIRALMAEISSFCDERDWSQFHNGKDLSAAIAIEAAELQQAFLWKKSEEASVDKIREELADVLIYALRMADRYELDVAEIIREKLIINGKKYPVNKARGCAKKYTEL